MRIDFYYFRYDQAYAGWDLWLWPKGGEGAAYPFTESVPLPDHPQAAMQKASVDLPSLAVPEVGFLVRRNGWQERDWASDRYINLVSFPPGKNPEVYLVQNTEQVFLHPGRISFIPTAERAVFRNFREIYIRLQAPCTDPVGDPFLVMGEGIPRKVIRTEALSDGTSFVLTLAQDWVPGESCVIFKRGYEPFPVQYGALYDTPAFERLFTYDGTDLGCHPSPEETVFRVWTPTASRVEANLFRDAADTYPERVLPLQQDVSGTWLLRVPEDLSGWYYTYNIINGGNLQEVCDPNAIGVSVNGTRALIARPSDANPPGWDSIGHLVPEKPTDAILYEVHVRDFTIHPESGVIHKGKFLGLAETGTHLPDGTKTGLDHLVELGVTHVHLMPVFDFYSIDESRLHENRFNWGYDPHLYNTPEGSYATDPTDGLTRVRELKEMILALKRQGIGVVMDVVYNHTYRSLDSELNKLVPGYFYRTDEAGRFSDGSGCGNETASERAMVRKTITDSVLYWAREYKVDGFRFDLMALHDIDTMNGIRQALDLLHPGLLLYGEGWTGGASRLAPELSASKGNAARLVQIGFFNDTTRDAIKGDNFQAVHGGYVNGNPGMSEGVRFGLAAAVPHPQVDARRAAGGPAWAGYPWHCVNYAASHDNLTLYDKLLASHCAGTDREAMRRTNLAGALVLLAQGIPFMLSGTEFLRSKKGMHNSYNMPDVFNEIDWNRKRIYRHSFDYHAGLIRLRKSHPAFRLTLPEDVRLHMRFLPTPEPVIAFQLRHHAGGDSWGRILVAFNGGRDPHTISIPYAALWHIVVDDQTAGCETLGTVTGSRFTIPQLSALVAWAEEESPV
jgi:pullulanase